MLLAADNCSSASDAFLGAGFFRRILSRLSLRFALNSECLNSEALRTSVYGQLGLHIHIRDALAQPAPTQTGSKRLN
jgi:hypothetical protein